MEVFQSKKKSINDVKDGLSSIIKEYYSDDEGKFSSIYYFIDEIDKCKPAYIVEMMSAVTRIFNIPEIIYVISADGAQLENALKAIYGSGFDTNNYFKNAFNLVCDLDAENKF